MTFSSIKPPRSLVEEVCVRIASEIRDEGSKNNEWLPPERTLAERLGVSRPVVREATKRLEQQGLVEVLHGVGTKVVDKLHKPLNHALALLLPDDQERLRQLVQVRLMLEPENARLAAINATPAQLKVLHQAVHDLQNATTSEEAIFADMAFHRAVATASGNQISALLLQSLSDLLHTSLSRGYRLTSTLNAVQQHTQILQAIKAKDAVSASAAMRSHLLMAEQDLALSQIAPNTCT